MRNYVDRCTGRYIHARLNNAEKSAWICTTYIDKKYAEILISLAKSDVEVKLISTNKQTGFFLRNYIASQSPPPNFKSMILTGTNFVHAKLYIIDDEYAIDGSVNLTANGFWNQPNYIHIHESKEEVNVVKDTFNRIWNYNSNKSQGSSPVA
jgi:phosphatidylserine/phosphatidylglycerophosphate/cardiolipin synthase-like enzyme